MESYKELLARRPKPVERPTVTTWIDGVGATVNYDYVTYNHIEASYTEVYDDSHFDWIRKGATVRLSGERMYRWGDTYDNVTSKITLVYKYAWFSLQIVYYGESRQFALERLREIVEAATPAIDAINAAKTNEDFEAALQYHISNGRAKTEPEEIR